MSMVVGNCSLCRGDVVDVDLHSDGARNAVYRPNGPLLKCLKCGAGRKPPPPPELPVIEMEPQGAAYLERAWGLTVSGRPVPSSSTCSVRASTGVTLPILETPRPYPKFKP